MIPSGMSMGFMLSFVLLGSLVLQTSINALGQNIIVAHTSARKITILLLLPFFALGTALSTYCSQNLGAKLYLRITQGINTSVLIAAAWWVLSLAFVWLVGDKMIMLITASQDLEIVTNAVQYLRINSALFMLPALICILRNSMQGFGDTRTPLISTQNPNNGH
jgi:Na+-driven multidrug efflux pump